MLSIGINLGWGCDTEKIEIMSSSTITRRYKYVKTIMYKTFVFSVVIILRQKAKLFNWQNSWKKNTPISMGAKVKENTNCSVKEYIWGFCFIYKIL